MKSTEKELNRMDNEQSSGTRKILFVFFFVFISSEVVKENAQKTIRCRRLIEKVMNNKIVT